MGDSNPWQKISKIITFNQFLQIIPLTIHKFQFGRNSIKFIISISLPNIEKHHSSYHIVINYDR